MASHRFRTIHTQSTKQRGYGSEHRKARARALAQLPDGSPCTRCGKPMWLALHSPLHYDHTDDRTTYRGFSHAQCNVVAGAKAGRARQQRKRSSIW